MYPCQTYIAPFIASPSLTFLSLDFCMTFYIMHSRENQPIFSMSLSPYTSSYYRSFISEVICVHQLWHADFYSCLFVFVSETTKPHLRLQRLSLVLHSAGNKSGDLEAVALSQALADGLRFQGDLDTYPTNCTEKVPASLKWLSLGCLWKWYVVCSPEIKGRWQTTTDRTNRQSLKANRRHLGSNEESCSLHTLSTLLLYQMDNRQIVVQCYAMTTARKLQTTKLTT